MKELQVITDLLQEKASINVSKFFVVFLAQYSGCNARENVIQVIT